MTGFVRCLAIAAAMQTTFVGLEKANANVGRCDVSLDMDVRFQQSPDAMSVLLGVLAEKGYTLTTAEEAAFSVSSLYFVNESAVRYTSLLLARQSEPSNLRSSRYKFESAGRPFFDIARDGRLSAENREKLVEMLSELPGCAEYNSFAPDYLPELTNLNCSLSQTDTLKWNINCELTHRNLLDPGFRTARVEARRLAVARCAREGKRLKSLDNVHVSGHAAGLTWDSPTTLPAPTSGLIPSRTPGRVTISAQMVCFAE